MLPSREEILRSAIFKTSRSGGKGGQNVNKVSSKVELVFNVETFAYFTDEEKAQLKIKLQNRMDSEGLLHVVSQEDRSQLMNKQRTVIKLSDLLAKCLQVQKKRKPTKIPKGVIKKRLDDKAVISSKKENRKKPMFD